MKLHKYSSQLCTTPGSAYTFSLLKPTKSKTGATELACSIFAVITPILYQSRMVPLWLTLQLSAQQSSAGLCSSQHKLIGQTHTAGWGSQDTKICQCWYTPMKCSQHDDQQGKDNISNCCSTISHRFFTRAQRDRNELARLGIYCPKSFCYSHEGWEEKF